MRETPSIAQHCVSTRRDGVPCTAQAGASGYCIGHDPGALEADGRPLEGLGPEDNIFNIAHQTFYAYLRKYAKRAGLGGLKPHDLRHTAAKLRRTNGASIQDVSALLGHRSIATTATYLARMEGEEDKGWEGVATALGVS